MRRETVYDILCQVRTEHRDFRTKAEQTLLGLTVLTEYNNKTYRIDDIKWDKSPESTFDMKGEQVSFVDYYKVGAYAFEIVADKRGTFVRLTSVSDGILLSACHSATTSLYATRSSRCC